MDVSVPCVLFYDFGMMECDIVDEYDRVGLEIELHERFQKSSRVERPVSGARFYSSFQNKNGTADLVYDGPIFLGCRLVVLSFFLLQT
jgi:hypothetical protein